MASYTKRQKTRIKNKVIEHLSSGNFSMREICEEDNMPPRGTIYRWRASDPEFDAACKRAEKGGYDSLASDILNKFEDLDFNKISKRCADRIIKLIEKNIGQEITADQMEFITTTILDNSIDARFANAEVQKVTNQFRAVMSFLSKRHPAKYGERLDINQTIDDKRDQTPEELEIRLKTLMDQRKKTTEVKH